MTLAPDITTTRIAAHMIGGRKSYGIDDAQV
ncbi:MAG: hypothetical protein QG671_3131, partial [Actinomycetota bacterium]|nr:hypothetical protein [Actinomycetota bacterium]